MLICILYSINNGQETAVPDLLGRYLEHDAVGQLLVFAVAERRERAVGRFVVVGYGFDAGHVTAAL